MFASSKSGAVADPKDSKFNYVTMLLHGNGTNGAQNNTFVDSSTNNFSITRNGNTTQGTFSPYGANWSNYFSSNSGLTAPNNSAFKPATNDFTVECWIFQTSSGTEQAIYGDSNSITDAGTFDFNINSSGFLKSDYWTSSTALTTRTSTLSPTVNQWNHVVLSRTGTTMYLGLNGVLQSFTAPSSYQSPATTYPTVGRLGAYTGGIGFIGYISNFRYINGTNLYSGSSYTVPTAPLTAVTNTKLLTCADNRFIDDSTNAFTLTVNGSPSVQRFSPFNATSAYSTSVIGGSGYFDGSGDYLSVANATALQLSGSQFTIEGWFYLTVGSTDNNEITCQSSSSADANVNFQVRVTSGNKLRFLVMSGTSPTYIDSTATIATNSWYHFACVCDGSGAGAFLRMWVNGVYQTASSSFNAAGINTNSAATQIGAWTFSSQYLTGYISDFRILKGTALYTGTSNITVPTTPLTAITNTSLLLSYTNAGIFDNAMMNDLETVGNAQISTSVKKYGTGSIAFDGTGDYLYGPTSPNTSFGTGDFTIEFWMYSNNVSGASQLGMLQMSDSAGGLKASYLTQLCINQGQTASGSALNGAIVANINNTNVGSTTAVLTTGTWYHIALVRSSGTVNLYVNGTSVGSATITSAINGPYIVVGGYYSSSFLFNGYLDDVRITKGFARYTSNFTAPTAAFADKG